MEENRLGHQHGELACIGCGLTEPENPEGKMRLVIDETWVMRICPDCLFENLKDELAYWPA